MSRKFATAQIINSCSINIFFYRHNKFYCGRLRLGRSASIQILLAHAAAGCRRDEITSEYFLSRAQDITSSNCSRSPIYIHLKGISISLFPVRFARESRHILYKHSLLLSRFLNRISCFYRLISSDRHFLPNK